MADRTTPKVTEFDLTFHGDEVIVTTADNGQITVQVRIITSADSHRKLKLRFETQSQLDRLFPSILQGMKPKRD